MFPLKAKSEGDTICLLACATYLSCVYYLLIICDREETLRLPGNFKSLLLKRSFNPMGHSYHDLCH